MECRKIRPFLLSRGHRQKERGVALMTVLLLMLLMTALTLAMVFSVRSDMLINGYYRNYRGAFYAADSGLNIGRQAMANSLAANVPATFPVGTYPLLTGATGIDSLVRNDITNNWVNKPFAPINGNGSYPEKYQITNATFSLIGCSTDVTPNCPAGPAPAKAKLFTYTFAYSLTSVGQSATGGEKSTLSDEGRLTITASVAPATTNRNFAGWGMFIDKSTICDGTTLVPGIISGPVFTNGAWNFGTSAGYTFTDTVGSASPTAGYQFSRSCDQIAGPADKTIAPKFEAGFNLGQSHVDLPKNDFNQERAVLDGKGGSTAVTTNDLHNDLRDIQGNSYPSGGTNSGVFLPYDTSGGSKVFKGGGIYVESSPGVSTFVTLTAGPGNIQIFTVKQGNKTTTVTVNPSAPNPLNNPSIPGTTTVTDSSGNSTTINGVPQMYDQGSGLPDGPANVLYVNGNITGISGPATGGAAIADQTLLTVTGNGNVAITGDIKYKQPPVQLVTDPATGLTTDQLTGNDTGQALGIFTANGDIQLDLPSRNPAPNLEIDASMATLCDPSAGQCAGGNGGLVNTGGSINTLTILGGRIQNSIKNIGATTRNVLFDQRFAKDNFAPPFFPSTTISIAGTNQTSINHPFLWQRTLWKNLSNF